MDVYDTSCQAVIGCPKCCMKPLQSLFSLVFVPSHLAGLRCSNSLAYRFSSKRETARSLDHHSYRRNFVVAKRKLKKNSGLNTIQILDLCDSAALYQLSYHGNWVQAAEVKGLNPVKA